ncbi:hypothetical protein SEUCBS139899_002846 [Sporothrix eucalyptigena]
MATDTESGKAATSYVDVAHDHQHRLDNLADDIDPRAIGGTLETMPKGYYYTPTFIGTFLGCMFSSMALFAGYTMPFNIVTIIDADIGPSNSYIWIPLVYTVTGSITYTVAGRMSDILGRRWFAIGANAAGLIGSIIAATAHKVPVVVGGTAFTGVAGAVQLLMPVLLGELLPNKHRPYFIAAIWLVGMPFNGFGPIVARSVVVHTAAGWRWVYYLHIILCGLAVVLLGLFYHPPTLALLHAKHRKRIFSYLDLGGIILFSAGLVLFILGLSWGGQEFPWRSSAVISTIVVGAVLLIVFVVYEFKMPISYPLMPPQLWKNAEFISTSLTASAGAMIYYSLNVLWPEQIVSLYTTDSIEIGWISCTVTGGTILGAIIACCYVKVLGHQKYQLIFATTGMTALIGAMASCDQDTKTRAIVFVTIGSVFVGMIEGITSNTTPLCLEQEDIGLAIGMLGSIRTGLSSIATAAYTAILAAKLETNISKYTGAVAAAQGIPEQVLEEVLAGLAAGQESFPDVPVAEVAEIANAYQTAYAKSFQVVYLVSIAFGVLSIIAAFFSPNLEHRFTSEVARRLHGTDIDKKEAEALNGTEDEKHATV